MTTLLDTEKQKIEGYAIVYFSDNGFEIFASDIEDMKLEIVLTTYPTLMGMMQNQDIKGLASTKIDDDLFLFAFALNLKNLDAKDFRLKRKTVTIVNLVVSRETHKELMIYFDEFEKFLQVYFKPIAFLFDLYAIDMSKIIPLFQEKLTLETKIRTLRKPRRNKEVSLATEFNRWLTETDIESIKKTE
ncbi:MAG: hypothetical protein GOP50_03690 [Candidatus Heimdallarchaeota archaeon]|nr:hypothetical protein [Candidatus Heimdallarchaeota archaeon]